MNPQWFCCLAEHCLDPIWIPQNCLLGKHNKKNQDNILAAFLAISIFGKIGWENGKDGSFGRIFPEWKILQILGSVMDGSWISD